MVLGRLVVQREFEGLAVLIAWAPARGPILWRRIKPPIVLGLRPWRYAIRQRGLIGALKARGFAHN